MVTDYSGHRRTLFPVREINLKACALVIWVWLTQPDPELNPGPCMCNHSRHCVKPPGQGRDCDQLEALCLTNEYLPKLPFFYQVQLYKIYKLMAYPTLQCNETYESIEFWTIISKICFCILLYMFLVWKWFLMCFSYRFVHCCLEAELNVIFAMWTCVNVNELLCCAVSLLYYFWL